MNLLYQIPLQNSYPEKEPFKTHDDLLKRWDIYVSNFLTGCD
jgi:hypothetical protein